MNDYDRKVKSDTDLMRVLLAGDVGGTKTQLGIYDDDTYPPTPLDVRGFKTLDFDGLSPIVDTFLDDHPESIAAACFGVAGPVPGPDRPAHQRTVAGRGRLAGQEIQHPAGSASQ